MIFTKYSLEIIITLFSAFLIIFTECKKKSSSLDKTIYVKDASSQFMKKELEKIKRGTIIIGSVVDPYQNVEKNYFLFADPFNFSTHRLNSINQKPGLFHN